MCLALASSRSAFPGACLPSPLLRIARCCDAQVLVPLRETLVRLPGEALIQCRALRTIDLGGCSQLLRLRITVQRVDLNTRRARCE